MFPNANGFNQDFNTYYNSVILRMSIAAIMHKVYRHKLL